MIPRSQIPTHSPLSFRTLVAGLYGALGAEAHSEVSACLRSHFAARDVLLTSSGTTALTLAIAACLRTTNKIIALPAYACYDLATAAVGADAQVVLYDLDEQTLAPNAESLTRALAQQPQALVLVHLYGLPVDVAAIARQAAAAGTIVIEDAAQAFGASMHGTATGSLGSVSILSFGRGKGLTGGSGGALLANDVTGDRIVGQARKIVHGARPGWPELIKTAAQWVLARPSWYELPAKLPFLHLGETLYHAPQPPAPLSNASAQMVREVWQDSMQARNLRCAHALRLRAAAEGFGQWQTIETAPGASPSYLRLPLLARQPRSELLDTRSRRLGIIQGYPLTLNELPGFSARCLNASEEFPGARGLAERLITLPTHGLLGKADLDSLERWLFRPGRITAPASDLATQTHYST